MSENQVQPRVLVIDPDTASEAQLRHVLGRACELVFQPDPLALFDALEIADPDLLIVEIDLPHLTGFEILSLVRTMSRWHALPVMILSAQRDVETQKLAYRLGAMHFQSKPARPSQLLKAAAMFARHMEGQPSGARAYPLERIPDTLAARRAAHLVHPLLEHAMGAHRTHTTHEHERESIQAGSLPRRAVLATVSGRHSRAA